MKYLKFFENFETQELDYDLIKIELKEHGWGDLSPQHYEDFENSTYYSGTKNSIEYAEEMDTYMCDIANGDYHDQEDMDDEYVSLTNESKKSNVTTTLKKKSKASGIPVGILRKVFSKGMQAWNSGHRPGVAQHQWAFGRVNSFITGSGGARKADAALWSKAKAAKARKKKK